MDTKKWSVADHLLKIGHPRNEHGSIDMSNKQLTSLEGLDQLVNPHKVKRLYLDQNLLSAIPAGTFAPFTELEELYLYNNKIAVLAEGLFDNLQHLRVLNLRNNNLRDISIAKFQSLPVLQELNINHQNT